MDQWVLGEVEEPRTTLADVGGMPAIKRWLSTAFLSSLRDPQMRTLFGRSLRGGLLIYHGPPRCGKTFLARAVAESWRRGSSASTSGTWWTCARLQPPQHPRDLRDGAGQRALPALPRPARRHQAPPGRPPPLDRAGGRRPARGRAVQRQQEHEVFVVAATEHPGTSTRCCAGPTGSTTACSSCRPTARPVRPSSARSWTAARWPRTWTWRPGRPHRQVLRHRPGPALRVGGRGRRRGLDRQQQLAADRPGRLQPRRLHEIRPSTRLVRPGPGLRPLRRRACGHDDLVGCLRSRA